MSDIKEMFREVLDHWLDLNLFHLDENGKEIFVQMTQGTYLPLRVNLEPQK